MNDQVLVYGANGYTGRFVVEELLERGLVPVLSARNSARHPEALDELRARFPGLELRPAAVEDESALASAMRGVAAVVNCAGPFLDSAVPVAAAAMRAGAHYLDVAAEQGAVQAVYRAHREQRWPVDLAVVPAMAFYGGLADLLATAAAGDWNSMDEVRVGVGLNRWWPTEGTRITGRRNTLARLIVNHGELVPMPADTTAADWHFPPPLGTLPMVPMPFSEIITMSRHLNASSITTALARVALDDVRDPGTPAPDAAENAGDSQTFTVEVVARRGDEERRISASGGGIYAVTAPLVVEAVERLLDGRARILGAAAPGETFDADDFLDALSPKHLIVRREGPDDGA
jgi:short subunit dehydrogenase-like uncharacterized protein